jgi:Polysaccharide pyruvyl transferase
VRPLRLLHLANHGGRNVGNGALIFGLERVLREDLPFEVEFLAEPWDLYSRGARRFDEDFVARVNRDSDALLVGAAVAFDGSAYRSETGFRFDLPLELWSRVEKPILFYGLSHRTFRHRPYAHMDALRRALERIVADERILFAARNDGTKSWLEGILGESTARIGEVPDPGVFVQPLDADHLELEHGRRHLIVAPNAEDEPSRWARASRRRSPLRPSTRGTTRELLPISSSWGWREARKRFVQSLARATGRIAQDHDVNIVFCSHDAFDLELSFELWQQLPDAVKYRAAFTGSAVTAASAPRFYDLYAKADAAISMRIHSMNPAIGIGTPVVPVLSQARMHNFMRDAGLSDLCVDAFAGDIEEQLVERAGAALTEPEPLRHRLDSARDGLRRRVSDFNAHVAEFLRQ